MKLRFLLFFCAQFSQIGVAWAETLVLKFDELPKLVKEKNQNVSAADLIVESADRRTGYLLRSFLPTIKAFAGTEMFQTGAYDRRTEPYWGGEIWVNVFRGGRDYLESESRKSFLRLAEAQTAETFATELGRARRYYWDLIYGAEVIEVLNQALLQNDRNAKTAAVRIQRGLATETDRLEFEVLRGQLEEGIESLKHEAKMLQIEFVGLLGLAPGTRLVPESDVPHKHDDPVGSEKFSLEEQYFVKALRANEQMAAYQRSVSNRWWVPSVDAYGGRYLYTLRDRDYVNESLRGDTVVGIRVSLELDPGNTFAEAKALALERQAQEHRARQGVFDKGAQVEVAKEKVLHEHELMHRSEKRIEQGKTYLSRVLDEYSRGVKNSVDVLSASQRQVDYMKENAERRRDYQLAKVHLLGLIGR